VWFLLLLALSRFFALPVELGQKGGAVGVLLRLALAFGLGVRAGLWRFLRGVPYRLGGGVVGLVS